MNAKLVHAFANRCMITEVTQFGSTEPSKNARLPDWVAEGFQPRIELHGSKEHTHSSLYPFGYRQSSTNQPGRQTHRRVCDR